ncbi:MAG: MraY family glycosyltransferase [Patescibacteria group bacterium]
MNWKDILLQYYKPAFFAFGLAFLLILLALKIFPKFGLMDRPEKYGLTRAPIPYYGGLAIFLAFIVSVFLFVPMTRELWGLILGAVLIVFVGFFDDLIGLSPWVRLFVQFLACVLLVIGGVGILSINFPFIGVIEFDSPVVFGVMILSVLFTIFWVVAITNTMNFVDGISGLSSGVAFVAGLTLFFLSIHPNLHENPSSQIPVAILSLIIAMVALGFLIFDFPKAKILMGDTGSTFLGFVLASLAIFSGGKVATAFLVLGIPILDMLWVVVRRMIGGQKFWKGDKKHMHHRLLEAGLSEKSIVVIYLLITAFFGFSAVMLVSSKQKFFMITALVLLMVLLASALVFLPNKEKK